MQQYQRELGSFPSEMTTLRLAPRSKITSWGTSQGLSAAFLAGWEMFA